jgi:hypothetical protein
MIASQGLQSGTLLSLLLLLLLLLAFIKEVVFPECRSRELVLLLCDVCSTVEESACLDM